MKSVIAMPKDPSPEIESTLVHRPLGPLIMSILVQTSTAKKVRIRTRQIMGCNAAGDVHLNRPAGALLAAYDGGTAATAVIREWFN